MCTLETHWHPHTHTHMHNYAGKSIDRMSSAPPALVLETAWATAALGAQMTTRWLNQWTVAVQVGVLHVPR